MIKIYSFPARSRAAMIEYIGNRQSRGYHYRTYPFCWNVKAYISGLESEDLHGLEMSESIDPAFDSQWDQYVSEKENSLFWSLCEDGGRYLSEGEWTSYPGNDQGDWKFSFEGRSGGWLVLNKWRGHDLTGMSLADVAEWCADLSFDELKAFYRGIVCADSDFTSDNAAIEVMYQATSLRSHLEDGWQQEREAENAAFAVAYQESRPDMYTTGE